MTGVEQRRFRRAISLLLMTIVAPGSAQLVAGNRQVGRIALRVLLCLVATVVLMFLLSLVASGFVISLLTTSAVLGFLRIVLIGLAIGWFALFVDAWRLAGPLGMQRNHRLAVSITAAVSCLAVVGALLTTSHYVAVTKQSIDEIFAARQVSKPNDGRLNVLLLGGDAGPGRVGLRPDSMTLVSIDAESGRAAMFSFPRNLQRVPFPRGSVMHEQFPNGFDCGTDCLLNAAYQWAEDHKNLFPGDPTPGLTATRGAIEELSGLQVNYYVLIDLFGFKDLINSLGGVVIDVKQPILIGGKEGQPTRVIEAGKQRLDGSWALWYARSRTGTSDYDRMARQRCVMSAMLQQFDPANVVLRFQDIAKAGKEVVSTDIPASELDTFVKLSMKAKRQKITSVQFVPPLIKPARPDIGLIREKVREGIEASRQGTAKSSTVTRAKATPKPETAEPAPSTPKPASDVSDLSSVCSAG
jgi:polyisoprenyl-teichoic acid--peptidoglycan teichoic acid transferase